MLTYTQVLRRVYDAREEFRSKSEMTTMDVTSLHVGDRVLAECWLVRRELFGARTATFELRSISLLKSASTNEDLNAGCIVDDVDFPWVI